MAKGDSVFAAEGLDACRSTVHTDKPLPEPDAAWWRVPVERCASVDIGKDDEVVAFVGTSDLGGRGAG